MRLQRNNMILTTAVLLAALAASAQYKGGSHDGFTNSMYNRQPVTDAGAFKGGSNDGVAGSVYTRQQLTDDNAFRGGNNDGFSNAAFNRQNNNEPAAFRGGNSDGFSSASLPKQNITDNNAFKGGSNDGYSNAGFSRQNITDAGAFRGGGNDGFVFSIYRQNAVLPVTLTSFAGSWQNSSAVLKWRTATENNTAGFVIERSFTGNSFVTVGTVTAAGNSSSINDYIYTDSDVALHNNLQTHFYYRLKTADRDGKFVYSAVILLVTTAGSRFAVTLYPNPASSCVNIKLQGVQNSQQLLIAVTDITGKIQLQKKIAALTEKLETNRLLPGQYFISIYNHNQLLQTIPFTVQH